jgi:hypothetical protein
LYVYISNPRLLFDLQFFLWRVGCVTAQIASHELEVQVPGAPSDEQAQREVELYIELWRGRKSFADVDVSIESSELSSPPS